MPKMQIPANKTQQVTPTVANTNPSLGRFDYGFHHPLTFFNRAHRNMGHM